MDYYITTTFSPAMIAGNLKFHGEEINFGVTNYLIQYNEINFIGKVAHENTAKLLEKKFSMKNSLFSRENLNITSPSIILAIIPQFRVDVSREYSDEEIASAVFRYFRITIE